MIGAWEYLASWGQRFLSAGRSLLERPFSVFTRCPGVAGFCLAFLLVAMTAHLGLSLADEGYEWYGAQRVLAGEIPLRDFMSYDPARYYCLAAVMWLLHSHGLAALQVGVALFAGLAVGLASSMLFRDGSSRSFLLCLMASLTFIMWLFPRHKIVDISVSVILVASLAAMLREPTRLRCFLAGLCIGIAAIFGRNHGLYGALAGVGGLAIVVWAERRAHAIPSYSYWFLGVVVGYLPMLTAMALVQDFWTWFWASIRVYFELGMTNQGVSVPWPWRVPLTLPLPALLRGWLVGLLLIVQPLFGITVTTYAVVRARKNKQPVDPLLLASGLLALVYTHHAYARAGLGHLAQAIYPLLIGSLLLITRMDRSKVLVFASAACAVSVFLLLPRQYWYQRLTEGNWVKLKVGPDTIAMDPYTAKRVHVLTGLVDRYAPAGREFMAVPYLPGTYALFDRRAPIWDTYPSWGADTEVQQAAIRRIQTERPGFVLIERATLDDNPAYAYVNTNPQVYAYILAHYLPVQDPQLPPNWGWDVYVPASPGQPSGQ